MPSVASISQQIWDMKYRLKTAEAGAVDRTIEDTWRRVATALAQPETLGPGLGELRSMQGWGECLRARQSSEGCPEPFRVRRILLLHEKAKPHQITHQT